VSASTIGRAMLCALGLGAAACGSFEDPNVVIDLRVLAMAATPPDQVIDVDLTQPVTPDVLLAQVMPTEVCALVADPGADRRLAWSMTACQFDSNEPDRCNPDGRRIALRSGVIEDPDTVERPQPLCATARPDPALLLLLSDIVAGDTLRGLGGVDYVVVLRIGGEDDDRALDEFAIKTVRLAPRIPAERSANTNPMLAQLAVIGDMMPVSTLDFGHCRETGARYLMTPGQRLQITPIETDGTREVYTVPTLDGRTQTFTESLTYQWIASAGAFSSGNTGGPRDISGNPAPIASEYRAPPADEVTEPFDATLWVIQRDERLGVRWYETCVFISP